MSKENMFFFFSTIHNYCMACGRIRQNTPGKCQQQTICTCHKLTPWPPHTPRGTAASPHKIPHPRQAHAGQIQCSAGRRSHSLLSVRGSRSCANLHAAQSPVPLGLIEDPVLEAGLFVLTNPISCLLPCKKYFHSAKPSHTRSRCLYSLLRMRSTL